MKEYKIVNEKKKDGKKEENDLKMKQMRKKKDKKIGDKMKKR